MDRYSVFAPRLLPQNEDFVAGLRSCPGCGQAMAVRIIAKAMANAGRFPYGAAPVEQHAGGLPYEGWPLFGGKTLALAQSISKQHKIIAAAGESGELQQGLDLLQEARRKKTALLYICLFNESGVERHAELKKTCPMPDAPAGILARFRHMRECLERARSAKPVYFATACPAYPFDLIEKTAAALACGGPAFIGVLCPCPTGCLYDAALSIAAGKSAVEAGLFPLYELRRGRCKKLIDAGPVPVSAYVQLQPALPKPGAQEMTELESFAGQNVTECPLQDN